MPARTRKRLCPDASSGLRHSFGSLVRHQRILKEDFLKVHRTAVRHAVTLAVVSGMSLFAVLPALSAASITIDSSSAVRFLDSGSTNTDFPSAFTATDFTSAQVGLTAFVLSSSPFYFPASDIPGAQWIGTNATAGTNAGDTALYAVGFVLPRGVPSASLSLTYGVDNDLGDTNAGIYINGTALPNSTGIPCGVGVACAGAFTSPNTYNDANIASALKSGTNWLYLDAVNLGAQGGLIFSADITYGPATVTPEPSTLLFLTLGMLGIGCSKLLSFRSSARRDDASRLRLDEVC